MTEIISYYEKNKERIKEKSRKYRRDNKDKIAQWKEDNAEKLKEYNKAYLKNYYQNHKEEHRERDKVWQEANIEKERQRKSLWKKENKDKVQEGWRRRRAKQMNVEGGHFTDAEFHELCEKYDNKCLRCGQTDVKLTADHVIPISLGLPHTDEITNIQPLCLSCNSRKHTKTVDYRP